VGLDDDISELHEVVGALLLCCAHYKNTHVSFI
jgi:hypothetical protein